MNKQARTQLHEILDLMTTSQIEALLAEIGAGNIDGRVYFAKKDLICDLWNGTIEPKTDCGCLKGTAAMVMGVEHNSSAVEHFIKEHLGGEQPESEIEKFVYKIRYGYTPGVSSNSEKLYDEIQSYVQNRSEVAEKS